MQQYLSLITAAILSLQGTVNVIVRRRTILLWIWHYFRNAAITTLTLWPFMKGLGCIIYNSGAVDKDFTDLGVQKLPYANTWERGIKSQLVEKSAFPIT
jgi:hypothetical protein